MNNTEAIKELVRIKGDCADGIERLRKAKKIRDSERAMSIAHYVRTIEAIDLAVVALSKP